MDFNRNHFFLVGILVLLAGLQLRLVESVVLNEKSTQFLARQSGTGQTEQTAMFFARSLGAPPRKTIRPPEWLGWCLMSVGAVLTLQSLAMRRPG